MFLGDAEHMANYWMEHYGLFDLGWKFIFMNGRKQLHGRCSPRKKQVKLVRAYVEWNDEDTVKDTILHEIAHALDWVRNKNASHGPTWIAICFEVECRPYEFHNDTEQIKEGVVGSCWACDYEYWKRNRMPSKSSGTTWHCPNCGYELDWKRV